ncbi:hypothetical protein OIO90_004282 [Microbotryomycetes sp. JL221]|nr:hypothetical protein OIO90_004282 [Microbotryomycetes sp. JL221]
MSSLVRAAIGSCFPTSGLTQLFPPNSTFVPDRDIGDLADQTIAVTGFNSGIGFEVTRQLMLHNTGHLLLIARSPERARDAIENLKKLVPQSTSKIEFVEADLSDLESVRRAGEDIVKRQFKINVLFNNAGVASTPKDQLTKQGLDMQWGSNVVGPFLLTKILRPCLEAGANNSGQRSRIVNTSSYLHQNAAPTPTGIDFDTFQGGPKRDAAVQKLPNTPIAGLYGQSKLGNIFISDEFAEWNPNLIHSCAVHPGIIRSNLMSHGPKTTVAKVFEWLSFGPEYGALPLLYPGLVKSLDMNRKYYIPWAREGAVSKQAKDKNTQRAVIEWIENFVKDY